MSPISQAVAGKQSLMVKPGFCSNNFSDFAVSKGPSGEITSVSTSELHIDVGSATLSFSSSGGGNILNEVSNSFTQTKDPAQPNVKTYKVQQGWSVDEDEGIFGVSPWRVVLSVFEAPPASCPTQRRRLT